MSQNLTGNQPSYWLPFTSNKNFNQQPVLFSHAKGMHYYRPDGSAVLDGIAGLWCVNAGHGHPRIVEAIQKTAAKLDYASSFQMSHPLALEYAQALAQAAPYDLKHVFFSNSGSEAVDTALKIALAYHRARGDGHRTRLIGRVRDYHGVGFGGLSVAGIASHRRAFGTLLPNVDHLPHTINLEHMAYSRGQPSWGAHLADDLEQLFLLHDPNTLAAVIVEPVAGSTGVLVPPLGYLQRLRQLCSQHGILLIFDEVITGFGRIDGMLSASYFGVQPDIVTSAKGLTNGAVPMGATFVSQSIHESFMRLPGIELPHGYTYSGHPLACAAGMATLQVMQEESLFGRAQTLSPVWEQAVHQLKGAPFVKDIRNIGLLAAIELEPVPGRAGQRAQYMQRQCLAADHLIRASGDTLLLSPPLIISEDQIASLLSTVDHVLHAAPEQLPELA